MYFLSLTQWSIIQLTQNILVSRTDDAATLEVGPEAAECGPVAVDDRHVVALLLQALRQGRAHAAAAHDDEVHVIDGTPVPSAATGAPPVPGAGTDAPLGPWPGLSVDGPTLVDVSNTTRALKRLLVGRAMRSRSRCRLPMRRTPCRGFTSHPARQPCSPRC